MGHDCECGANRLVSTSRNLTSQTCRGHSMNLHKSTRPQQSVSVVTVFQSEHHCPHQISTSKQSKATDNPQNSTSTGNNPFSVTGQSYPLHSRRILSYNPHQQRSDRILESVRNNTGKYYSHQIPPLFRDAFAIDLGNTGYSYKFSARSGKNGGQVLQPRSVSGTFSRTGDRFMFTLAPNKESIAL